MLQWKKTTKNIFDKKLEIQVGVVDIVHKRIEMGFTLFLCFILACENHESPT